MIEKEFNTKAFINCHDYQSFEDVLEYIRYLDNNDEAYLEVMRTPVFSDMTCGQNYMTEALLESFLLQIVGGAEATHTEEIVMAGERCTKIVAGERIRSAILYMEKYMENYFISNRRKI